MLNISFTIVSTNKLKNMKTLEIRTSSIKVKGTNGMELLVARYEDKNGVYFLNENLEKQYAIIETPKKQVKVSSLESFNFYVEYFHNDDSRRKFTTVKAKDFDSALNKVNRNFKSIIEIEEV